MQRAINKREKNLRPKSNCKLAQNIVSEDINRSRVLSYVKRGLDMDLSTVVDCLNGRHNRFSDKA